MKKKCKITVTYQSNRGIDPDIDEKIREAMEKLGATWYACGFYLPKKSRDIAFDWEIETELHRGTCALWRDCKDSNGVECNESCKSYIRTP